MIKKILISIITSLILITGSIGTVLAEEEEISEEVEEENNNDGIIEKLDEIITLLTPEEEPEEEIQEELLLGNEEEIIEIDYMKLISYLLIMILIYNFIKGALVTE